MFHIYSLYKVCSQTDKLIQTWMERVNSLFTRRNGLTETTQDTLVGLWLSVFILRQQELLTDTVDGLFIRTEEEHKPLEDRSCGCGTQARAKMMEKKATCVSQEGMTACVRVLWFLSDLLLPVHTAPTKAERHPSSSVWRHQGCLMQTRFNGYWYGSTQEVTP